MDEYNLINNESNIGTKSLKDYRMDLVFKKDYHTVIIEMQGSSGKSVDIKNYQYLFREAGSLYPKGEKFVPGKATLICFNNFITSNISSFEPIHYKFTDSNYNITKEYVESYEISIPNYKKIQYNDCNEFERKLWLIGIENFDLIKNIELKHEDKIVVEELEVLNMDPEFIKAYEDELAYKKMLNSMHAEGYDEGKELGIQEGIQQNKIETIKKLYEMNMSYDKISEVVNLSVEEVKEIISNE